MSPPAPATKCTQTHLDVLKPRGCSPYYKPVMLPPRVFALLFPRPPMLVPSVDLREALIPGILHIWSLISPLLPVLKFQPPTSILLLPSSFLFLKKKKQHFCYLVSIFSCCFSHESISSWEWEDSAGSLVYPQNDVWYY